MLLIGPHFKKGFWQQALVILQFSYTGFMNQISLWTKGHKDSVEDSPAQDFIFASCSVDKTIKIWDI